MGYTETKIFLISRELIDEQLLDDDNTIQYLSNIVNNNLTLINRFEEKMANNNKFKKHVLNEKEINKNIYILNKCKDENDKYNAIIKIINKYLYSSK